MFALKFRQKTCCKSKSFTSLHFVLNCRYFVAQALSVAMDERQLCFRLLGSNALITSVPIKAYLDLVLPVTLCGADNRYTLLQSCVAAKLGLPRNCQVTIHYNGMRLTPDVLLGAYSQSADNYHHYKLLAAKLVKEAWQCFEAQLKTAATGDLELNVTRCSDADIDAAQLLAQKLRDI